MGQSRRHRRSRAPGIREQGLVASDLSWSADIAGRTWITRMRLRIAQVTNGAPLKPWKLRRVLERNLKKGEDGATSFDGLLDGGV